MLDTISETELSALPSEVQQLTEAQWLEIRPSIFGATDAVRLLRGSPLELWAEKTRKVPRADLSTIETVRWGLRLERSICDGFAEDKGRRVSMWRPFAICRDPDALWRTCTPDALQWADGKEGPGLLQVKNVGSYLKGKWQDGPPLKVQVQIQHELAVSGLQWATGAGLIGGNELLSFDIERDERFIQAMRRSEDRFWRQVRDDVEPEVDDRSIEATAAILKRLHPEDNGQTTVMPPDADYWHRRHESLKAAKTRLEKKAKEFHNKLAQGFGANTFGTLPDGRILSYKTQDRAGYTAKPTSYRVLREEKQ